jgi:hypothetical protein
MCDIVKFGTYTQTFIRTLCLSPQGKIVWSEDEETSSSDTFVPSEELDFIILAY